MYATHVASELRPKRAAPRLCPQRPRRTRWIPPGAVPMRPTSVCVVGCVALFTAGAQAQAPTGQIQGAVRGQAGAPLGGVSVTVTATRFGAVTGSDGRYPITAVPPGTYRVRARVIGYGPAEDSNVVVGAGTARPAHFQLQAQAHPPHAGV